MNQRFKFGIYLPTLSDYCHFTELSSSHYLDIIKFIQNGDNDRLAEILDSVVSELTDNIDILPLLTRIDIFCILLNLRIICIGSKIELKLRCPKTKKTFNVPVDLYDILDSVTNYNIEYTNTISVAERCHVSLCIPRTLASRADEDIILSCIDTITLYDKAYNTSEYTVNEKEEILDRLPGNILTKIVEHITSSHAKYNVHAIKYRSPHDQMSEPVTYDLQLYNNSFFEFIKTIYNANLEEQYYMRYILSHRMGFDLPYVESRTPAELDTYIGFYKQELEDQKKEQEKNNSGNQVPPGPTLPQQPGFPS